MTNAREKTDIFESARQLSNGTGVSLSNCHVSLTCVTASQKEFFDYQRHLFWMRMLHRLLVVHPEL
jgi:hypothetical protein